MALDSMEGSLGGGLIPIAKSSRRKLVMMQGDITRLHIASPENNGVLVNGNVPYSGVPRTEFNTDTVLASEQISVGDRIFQSGNFTQHLQEIGIVTAITDGVGTNSTITIGAGTGPAFPDPLAPIDGRSLINNAFLSVAAVYDINMDGVVTPVSGHGTSTGALASDVRMHVGCGRISVYGVDTNAGSGGTAAQINRGGTAMTIEFTFGNELSFTDSLNLVSAVGSFGYDMDGGKPNASYPPGSTHPVRVDRLAWGHCARVAGNTARFTIGLPYEQEGGTQENIASGTTLKFCVMAIADDGGV